MPNTALLIKNPLAATHEFKQACQLCYPKTGNSTFAAAPLCPGNVGNPRVWRPHYCVLVGVTCRKTRPSCAGNEGVDPNWDPPSLCKVLSSQF